MKLKKLVILGILGLGGLGSSASALEFDFALGAGLGFENNIYKESFNKRQLALADKVSDVNWNGGGFVGAGVMFGKNITSSVGLEWTGQFQSFNNMEQTSYIGILSKRRVDLSAFGQFADIYYRLGFVDLIPGSPMAFQFNFGLATRELLETKIYVDGRKKSQFKYGSDSRDSVSAIGVHLGFRANIHLFFIGIDYAYFPTYESLKLDFLTKVIEDTTNKQMKWEGNQISFTMGVTLNKSLLYTFF